MNLLVNKNTGAVQGLHHSTPRWVDDKLGPGQQSGELIWLPIPSDCAIEDAVVVLLPEPHVEQNVAQRQAREVALAARLARKKAIDEANPQNLGEALQLIQLLLAERRGD
jgi:hypothetical protein